MNIGLIKTWMETLGINGKQWKGCQKGGTKAVFVPFKILVSKPQLTLNFLVTISLNTVFCDVVLILKKLIFWVIIQCPPKVWRQSVIILLPSITTPCPIKLKKILYKDLQSVYTSPYRRWGASCRVCLPGPSVWSPTRGAWSLQTASSGASGPGSCPGPCGQGLTRPRRHRPDYPSIATWNSSRRSWLHVTYAGLGKVDRSWVYILATWKQLCIFVMN